MLPRNRLRNRSRAALFLAASSATLGLVENVSAAGGTWTFNSPGNWSSPAGWFGGFVADGANEIAAFGTGQNIIDTLTVTLDSTRTIGRLAFADSVATTTPAGWRLTGASVLTLQGGVQPTIDVGVLGTGDGGSSPGTLFQRIANIDAVLSGTQGLNKTGAGTLVLSGNNAGLSGSITLTQGNLIVNNANALGSDATITQVSGQLAFRRDTSTNFAKNVVIQNDLVLGVGNAITTGGQYGTGANQTHSLNQIVVDTYGRRTLTVSGSNGYGLSVNRLALRDGIRVVNQGATGFIFGAGDTNGINGLGSGTMTIGSITYDGSGAGSIELGGVGSLAGSITVNNALTQTGSGSASLAYFGDKTLTLNGPVSLTGDVFVTGGTTGSVAAGNYQAGVGTMIVNSGTLPSNRAVTINGGTILLNGGALSHNISALTLGGATLTGGAVPAHLNLGLGTYVVGSGGVVVNDSVAFNTGTTTASAIATAAGITGTVDLGGVNRSVAVAGTSTLTVNGQVTGSGGIIKSGTGALLLNGSGSNTFTGNIDIQDGMVSGNVRTSGNAFGAGSAVSLGGSLRLVGSNVAGTGTVSTLSSKDTGGHEGLIVDASLGGVTTLNINTYTGRDAGTRGTIKVVPVTGSMNTNEIVRIATGAPLPTNGILPAYFAVQNSGTNTQLGFAGIASNRITSFGGYAVGGINAAAINAVYDQTATETLAGGKQVYALRIGAGASLNGAQILTLGDGAAGFGGLIMNGGAMLNASTLTTQAGQELVVWSGGSAVNTITSGISLLGDLTTGGSQALDLTGTLNFNGSTRNVTVTGGTTTLSGNSALNGGTAFVKRGGGVLAITGSNILNNGTVGIVSGTLQLGNGGLTGSSGNGAITNNANLSINRDGTFANAVSGSGKLWVNLPSAAIVTATGALTYTGETTVQAGTLRINAPDRLPTSGNLRVESAGTFDLNGFSQSINRLTGNGTITNGVTSTGHVIAVNEGTFSGGLRNGAGTIGLIKNGSGLLVMDGNTGSFSGPIIVNGGTLQIDNGLSIGQQNVTAGPTGTITLNNSVLVLNNTSNRTINRPFAFTGVSTIAVTANPNPAVGPVLDNVGVAITGVNSVGANGAANQGGWSGGGTLVLDLRGRQLDIGANNIANPGNGNGGNNVSQTFANFTGTLMFADSNPVGSWTRWAAGVNGFATGNPLATFAFGSGYNNFSFRNGTIQMHMGFVSGGTNTVLYGCENADNRTVIYNIGNLPGAQTFFGAIRDYDRQNGEFALVGLDKEGSNSSLTLRGVHDYTRPTTINAGTLIMGPGGNIRGSTTITISNGTLLMNGGTFGGTFGGSGQFINIAAAGTNTIGGALDVTAVPGYSTPPSVTYVGGGTVYGNVNHNVGTMNPGTVGGFGTLTFNNNLNIQDSNLGFDVVAGLTNNLGATVSGTNDVLSITPNNGLSLSGGITRLNFTGAGSAALVAGQYYPLIKFNGSVGGAGPASMQAIALFKGSFLMVQGTGSLASTLGVQVVSPSAPASSITWKPTPADPTDTWDIGGAQNWIPNGGGGQTFYFNEEGILFDDTTTHRNVNLAPTFLAPSFLTINTNNVYTFSGAGTITGGTSLVKNGSGTLVIQTRNNFTGGATINDGFVLQDLPTGAFNSLGTATIALNGDAGFGWTAPSPNAPFGPGAGTLVVNGNNTLVLPYNQRSQDMLLDMRGNGTLTVIKGTGGGGANGVLMRGSMTSFTGTIVVAPTVPGLGFQLSDDAAGSTTGNFGSPSAIFDLGSSNTTLSLGTGNRTFDIGALVGVNGFVTGNEYNNTATYGAVSASNTATISIGAKNVDATFGGQIVNANGNNQTHVVKVGSFSTQTLTTNQTYTGNTLINAGTLAVTSATPNPFLSPTIVIGTAGVLDISQLNGGLGLILNGDQRLISNGDVVGGSVEAVATSTIGGTNFSSPLIVNNGATVSPGNNNVAALSVGNLQLGSAIFLIEGDQTGIDRLILTEEQTTQIVNAQSSLQLVNLGGLAPGTYTFLDYTGDWQDQFGIEFGFLPADFSYQVQVFHDTADTSVKLTLTNNTAQWFVNSNGTWSTANNWTMDGTNPSAIVPNAVTFGTFIQAPRTVNVNGTTGNVANSMVFNSPNKYTIAGPGTLTLDAGAAVPVTVLQGSHAINAPVRALKTLSTSVPTGLNLSFGGTITNANNAGFNKIGGGSVTLTRLSMPGGTLTVGAGTVVMAAKGSPNSPNGTNLLGGLTIAAGAKVDLTDNAMALDSGTNATVGAQLVELRQELADGRLFSSNTTATTTLGYRSNNTGTTAAAGTGTAGVGLNSVDSFAGVAVDGTSVLVRITYKGDSNLDGIVNVLDLVNLALNWGSTNGVWAGGDFNYDGLVNAVDLGILSQQWQNGVGNPLPSTDLGAALTSAGIPLSAIPEPGTLSLAGIGALGLLSRRRRRA